MDIKGISPKPGEARGQAVAVLIITPEGIPLVRDPKKPPPVFWKAPGGRSRAEETAEETAMREIKEEIGISISPDDLRPVHKEDKGSHIVTLFVSKLMVMPRIKSRGDEGEEIKIFPPREIAAMPDFFPNHRKAYGKIIDNL